MVSIIIPCYNHGEFITETVLSVINSTFKDYEIIIVNDGSTDPMTINLLKNSLWPQTKIINTSNQGLAEARNTGIRNSNGKYILPLDADDKISSYYLEEAVTLLEENKNFKLITCDVQLFGALKDKMDLLEFNIENLLCQNTMVCSSIYRREDYNKTSGYNSNMKYGFEDWDFWLSLLGNGGEVYKIPKIHMYYRIKKRSMIADLSKKTEQLRQMRYQIYQNHKELYSKHFFDPTKSFEYDLIKKSKEYKLGRSILMPVRYLINLWK